MRFFLFCFIFSIFFIKQATFCQVQQWGIRYDGTAHGIDQGNAIITDNFGNVYITGFSTNLNTSLDFCTIKYNSAGMQQWLAIYNGFQINYSDQAVDIVLDNSNNIYVSGTSESL